jgi:hypothetical protein
LYDSIKILQYLVKVTGTFYAGKEQELLKKSVLESSSDIGFLNGKDLSFIAGKMLQPGDLPKIIISE